MLVLFIVFTGVVPSVSMQWVGVSTRLWGTRNSREQWSASEREEMFSLGKRSFLGVTLSPVCSLWAKIGPTLKKSTWMPHTNFYFKLCFRAAVNNTTAHPVGSLCQDSTVAKCLHDTPPRSGYLNQFLIYKTDWKDLVLKPYEGREPGGLLAESESLHYFDQTCKMLCTGQVKCVPRRQKDHDKD